MVGARDQGTASQGGVAFSLPSARQPPESPLDVARMTQLLQTAEVTRCPPSPADSHILPEGSPPGAACKLGVGWAVGCPVRPCGMVSGVGRVVGALLALGAVCNRVTCACLTGACCVGPTMCVASSWEGHSVLGHW